jgi:ribose transport system substrate-binding protein
MKSKNVLKIFTLIIVLSMALSACAKPTAAPVATEAPVEAPAATEAPAAAEKIKLGFVPMDLSVQFFSSLLEGAKAFEAAHPDVELIVVDGANDVSKQVTGVENLINAGAKAIDLRCLDEAALADTVKNTVAQGIYVNTYPDSMVGRSTGVAYDDYNRGFLLAKEATKWVNEKLGGSAEVAFLFEPNNQNAMKRITAFRDVFAADAPNAKIVAEQQGFTTDVGMATAESILQAHPNVKVIICSNDAACTGVYEAVMSAGKATDDFFIGGIDGDTSAMELIAKGGIYRATVAAKDLVQDQEWQVMQNLYNAVTTGKYLDQIVVEEFAVTYDTVAAYLARTPTYGK